MVGHIASIFNIYTLKWSFKSQIKALIRQVNLKQKPSTNDKTHQ
jgi:hypothetical protein